MTTQEQLDELHERIGDAALAIDRLADLLSDSTELRVMDTPAISVLNDILAILLPTTADK